MISSPVCAQPEAPDAEARRLYAEGRKAFDLGEFEKSIVAYKAAYKLKPDAALLFNIAQSYRLANDPTSAAFFYKSFLRNRPDAPNRAEVEERIKQMDEAARKGTAPVSPPAAVPPPATPPPAPPAAVAPQSSPSLPPPMTAAPTPPVSQPTTVIAARPDGGDTKDAKPFYLKPWAWGVGAAVVVGLIAGVVLASGGGGNSAPRTELGTKRVF